jgi:hypothetical protein
MGRLIHTKDYEFFNCIANEVNELAGYICYYYRLMKDDSIRDPLYDELLTAEYQDTPDGLKLTAFQTNPEHATTTGEEGVRTQWDAQWWISRMEWEDKTEATEPPQIGDLINAWDGLYYEVIDTNKDGIMNDDRRFFTLWKVSLTRKTKFEPWWHKGSK